MKQAIWGLTLVALSAISRVENVSGHEVFKLEDFLAFYLFVNQRADIVQYTLLSYIFLCQMSG